MKYVIKGEPLGLVSVQEYSTWNESKAQRLNYSLQLRNQHDEKPLLHGPMAVNMKFYFLAAIDSKCKRKKQPGGLHTQAPSIGSLIRVIEDLGRGIIFANNSHVAEIKSSKYYDNDPRTEITFSKLKDGDEKD